MADSDNLLFQNIDIPSNNPLDIKETPTKPILTKKKIIIFSGVGLLFVLLILLVVLGTKFTQKNSGVVSSQLTPTPEISQNTVSELGQKLNEIDTFVNDNRRFLPPEIDLKLGE